MQDVSRTRNGVSLIRRCLTAGAFLIGLFPLAAAAEDDSRDLLKKMSEYMAAQKTFSFDYQSSVEAVTKDFQKLQFVSSGTVAVSRPDKIRLTRKGGFADIDMSYDGTTLTVHGKNLDAYAKIEAKGSLDELHDRLENAGFQAPGADLLSSNIFDLLSGEITDAKHIASAVVDGIDCEYLAFRTPEVDWEIWVKAGSDPIPLRYVVTSKHTVQAPQYTIEIRDFKSGADVANANFNIEIPAAAKQVDISQMDMLDELPAPTDEGDAQ